MRPAAIFAKPPLAALLLACAPRRPPVAAVRCCAAEPTFADSYSDALPGWLLERVQTLGFERPTTVQAEALDAVIEEYLDAGDEQCINPIVAAFLRRERI